MVYLPVLATGGPIAPPPAQLRPEYKTISDLRGGLNDSIPPDQLADNETPASQNLAYRDKVLSVDFGLAPIGSPVVGTPLAPIAWVSPTNILYSLLVTTRTLYLYDEAYKDWVPVPTSFTDSTMTSSEVIGPSVSPVVSFTGPATWVTGQLVAIMQDNWLYFVGEAQGTVSPVTITGDLPAGRTLAIGSPILPLPTFTTDGTFAVSWAPDALHGWLVITNGVDHVQYFDGALCNDLPGLVAAGITAARYATHFQSVMCLFGTTEGGNLYSYRVRRSATSDPTNWTTLDAGFDDLIDTSDEITGAFLVGQNMVITRRKTVIVAYYYGVGDQVFWYNYTLIRIGTLGRRSVTPTKMASVIISDSGIYDYAGDSNVQDIGDKIFQHFIGYLGDLNPQAVDQVIGFYVPTLDEVWVLYPSGSAPWPNTLRRFNLKTGAWFTRVFSGLLSFIALGEFYLVGTSFRWIDLGSETWQESTKTWADRVPLPTQAQVAFCGALDNQVYLYNYITQTDNGQPIPWSYTTKDYTLPQDWETLDGLAFYGEGTIASVKLSTDAGQTWRVLGTNLVMGTSWGRAEVDCSLTVESVRLLLEGTDPNFKLSWFAFKTMTASEK